MAIAAVDDGRKLERVQVHLARVKQEWSRDAYSGGFVSTLELIWQHDAPYAVVRSDDGVLTDDGSPSALARRSTLRARTPSHAGSASRI